MILSGIVSPFGKAGSGGGRVTVIVSPDLTVAAGSRIVRAAIVTWPARINVFRWERDSFAICVASTRSSRSPTSSAAIVTVSVTLFVMAQDMAQDMAQKPSSDDRQDLDPAGASNAAQ